MFCSRRLRTWSSPSGIVRGAYSRVNRRTPPDTAIYMGLLLVARPPAKCDRDTEGGDDIILEVVAAAEIAVIEVILDIETESHSVVLTAAEPEAKPDGATKVGRAPVIVEGVAAAGD